MTEQKPVVSKTPPVMTVLAVPAKLPPKPKIPLWGVLFVGCLYAGPLAWVVYVLGGVRWGE